MTPAAPIMLDYSSAPRRQTVANAAAVILALGAGVSLFFAGFAFIFIWLIAIVAGPIILSAISRDGAVLRSMFFAAVMMVLALISLLMEIELKLPLARPDRDFLIFLAALLPISLGFAAGIAALVCGIIRFVAKRIGGQGVR